MSEKLKKQVRVELEQLNELLETHETLLNKVRSQEPDPIELSALAAMLHAFYTGSENLFKRVTIEIDGGLEKSEFWHQELLKNMANRNENRPSVISQALMEKLRPYLDFRHVFRQAYTFQLRWSKMSALVLECREVFARLEKELGVFLATAHE